MEGLKTRIAGPEDHDLMQIPRHALHALGISFSLKGEAKCFVDHLPKDLTEWMEKNLKIKLVSFEKEVMKKVTHYLS